MTTTQLQTSYLKRSNAPTRSLTEVSIADATTKIDAFSADLDRDEAEIARLADVVSNAWRDPERARVISEDLEAVRRRVGLTKALRKSALAEREILERQVRAEALIAARGRWDTLMSQRTSKARDLVATLHMVAGLVRELDTSVDEVLAEFQRPLEGGLTVDQLSRNLRRESTQSFVDEALRRLLPKNLWDVERPTFPPSDDLDAKLPGYIDRERTAGLAAFDLALERVTRGQAYGAEGATDWANYTTEQAREAGLTERVLCSDGFYVPDTH